MRLPVLDSLSSNCFANRRLWAAKASRGDMDGGTSPATCKRGERRGRELVVDTEVEDCDLRSRKPGLFVIAQDR